MTTLIKDIKDVLHLNSTMLAAGVVWGAVVMIFTPTSYMYFNCHYFGRGLFLTGIAMFVFAALGDVLYEIGEIDLNYFNDQKNTNSITDYKKQKGGEQDLLLLSDEDMAEKKN